MEQKKALIVVTSVEKYPNMERATGLWYNRENKISIFFKQNIQKNNTFELKYNG